MQHAIDQGSYKPPPQLYVRISNVTQDSCNSKHDVTTTRVLLELQLDNLHIIS